MSVEEKLIGPQELAETFALPVSWVYAKAETGELPSFKLGKYVRFRASEVAQWLEAHRRGNGKDNSE